MLNIHKGASAASPNVSHNMLHPCGSHIAMAITQRTRLSDSATSSLEILHFHYGIFLSTVHYLTEYIYVLVGTSYQFNESPIYRIGTVRWKVN